MELEPLKKAEPSISKNPSFISKVKLTLGRVFSSSPKQDIPEIIFPAPSTLDPKKFPKISKDPHFKLLMSIANALDKTGLFHNVVSFKNLVNELQPTDYHVFENLFLKLKSRDREEIEALENLEAAINTQNIKRIKSALKTSAKLEKKWHNEYCTFLRHGSDLVNQLSVSEIENDRVIKSIKRKLVQPLYPNRLARANAEATIEITRLKNAIPGKKTPNIVDRSYALHEAGREVKRCYNMLIETFPDREINSFKFNNDVRSYFTARSRFLSIFEQLQTKIDKKVDAVISPTKLIEKISDTGLSDFSMELLGYLADEDDEIHFLIEKMDRILTEHNIEKPISQEP